MALGDIEEIVNQAAKVAGTGKAKKSPVEKELDNFGKQILDTEAKWRIASLSTLKGLNRFISAVNKAAETVEKLKGLRAEGIAGPSMGQDIQRRYANLQNMRRMAERAISNERLEKQLQDARQKGLEEQIKDAKRASQLSAKKAIAYGPSYLASQKTTAGPAAAESFIMQRKGRAVPIAADYQSSRVSGIRAPGTEMVPAGGRDIELYKQPGGLYAPQNYGPLATGGVPIRGYTVPPRYNVPGPYMGGGGGGGGRTFGGIPAGAGALLGGAAETLFGAAKAGFTFTREMVAKHQDELENIYRASRTGGRGSYAGYLGYLSPTGEANTYNVEHGLATMGFDIHRAAEFQNRYASPFRAKTAMETAGALGMGAITGNIPTEDWADLMRKELSMGMLSGKTGMEQFKKTMTDAMTTANKHTLPAPEVLENVERYLQVMASSSAIRSTGEVARMAGAAGNYGLPNWRNFSVQATALSAYQNQLENLPGNPLRMMEAVVAATGFNGGRTPVMSSGTLEKFVSKFGGGNIHFNAKQREGIEEAIKTGGMIGFNAEMTMAMMAGAKPEFLKNIGLNLFTRGMGAKKGAFMPAYMEYLTGGAGPGGVLGPWAAGAAGTTGGGMYPMGMSPEASALADKINLTNPTTGKPYGEELRTDTGTIYKVREEAATMAATTTAGAVTAINNLEPTVNKVDDALNRLIGAFDFASGHIRTWMSGGAAPSPYSGPAFTPRGRHVPWAAPEAPGSSGAPPGILGPGSVHPGGSPHGASTGTTSATPGSS